MKSILLCLLISFSACFAAERSSTGYHITADAVIAAGQRSASAGYTNTSSAGAIVGVASEPDAVMKHGYIGQLYELAGFGVLAAGNTIDEAGTLQLTPGRLADDGTGFTLPGVSAVWSVLSGPLASVSSNGLVTASLVGADAAALVRGVFEGQTFDLPLTVRDTIADNFGAYAADGIADSWQLQFFGADNPLAAPDADATGTGQRNLFKFIAGLNPIDRNAPNAVFESSIDDVPGQPGRMSFTFSPRFGDRLYVVKYRTSLTEGMWLPLVNFTIFDSGTTRTVTDLDADGMQRFYHVEITKP